MLFRDNYKTIFPRTVLSNEKVLQARNQDIARKEERDSIINNSKFRKCEEISVGDVVMMRNHRRTAKFDPYFIPEPFDVGDKQADGRNLIVVRRSDGSLFRRHPDDVKKATGLFPKQTDEHTVTKEAAEIEEWHQGQRNEHCDDNNDDNIIFKNAGVPTTLRRSQRTVQRNPKYFNDNFETT